MISPRNSFSFLLSPVLVVVLLSCSRHTINLSILEPASVTLPDSIQRISILPIPGMPSTLDTIPILSGSQILPEYRLKGIKMGYLKGVYDVMRSSPGLQKVVMSDTSMCKLDARRFLFWDDLQQICLHDTTDVILLLSRITRVDSYIGDQELGFSRPTYVLYSATTWRFYSPEKYRELARFTFNDTVYVPKVDVRDLAQQLYDACYFSGMNSGNKLFPHWNDWSERYYFSGLSGQKRKAARLMTDNQWSQAASIWNKLAESHKKRLASRAAFNIALAFEHDDILDQALSWVSYADSLKSTSVSAAYMRILEDRIKKKTLLNQQLNLE